MAISLASNGEYTNMQEKINIYCDESCHLSYDSGPMTLGAIVVNKTHAYKHNNAIREICANKGIDVFDVYNEIPFDKDRDTVDGVHPTQDFVTNVWSPAITEFIRQNYKK